MKFEDKLKIVKHIKLGTKETFYFPYNNGKEPLPLRPISSYELDQCYFNSVKDAPENVAKLLINLRLKRIDMEKVISVSENGYANLQKFYDEFDYWIVYYGMKDFQDEEFRKPDFDHPNNIPFGMYIVREMKEVHDIADTIMDGSNQPKEVIKSIFKDSYGREIAYYNLYMNVPISDSADITQLQKEFILYSKGHIDNITEEEMKNKTYSVSGEKMTLKEFLERAYCT